MTGTSATSTSSRHGTVCVTMRPTGSIKALIPVLAQRTIARRVSIARKVDSARRMRGSWVSPSQESFETFTHVRGARFPPEFPDRAGHDRFVTDDRQHPDIARGTKVKRLIGSGASTFKQKNALRFGRAFRKET